jgi:hypothetical protein
MCRIKLELLYPPNHFMFITYHNMVLGGGKGGSCPYRPHVINKIPVTKFSQLVLLIYMCIVHFSLYSIQSVYFVCKEYFRHIRAFRGLGHVTRNIFQSS